MSGFIEEFYYGNIDPQARSTRANKAMTKELQILDEVEQYLTEKLSDEAKRNAIKWLQAAVDAGSKSARMGLFSAKVSWPSTTQSTQTSQSSQRTNNYVQSTSCEEKAAHREFTFMDGKGNYTVSGNVFYDFRGNLCEWGSPFYDSKGNFCEWGGVFYDGRGNLCEWGRPFYDSRGNYIVPNP